MTNYVRVAAGTPLTNDEVAELRALAQTPDSEIDFSDIPERIYEPSNPTTLPLEEHTVTLRVDAEVAEWLENAAKNDANRLNRVLKREAKRGRQSVGAESAKFDKAS